MTSKDKAKDTKKVAPKAKAVKNAKAAAVKSVSSDKSASGKPATGKSATGKPATGKSDSGKVLSKAKLGKIAHAQKTIANRSKNADRKNMLKIVQYKSAIRRNKKQSAILQSLGLHSGANSVNYLPNSEKVLKQIKSVEHLVQIVKD